MLSLEVSDNGRGLTQDDLAKARSFGIRGLHERAGTVGGWVDLSQRAHGHDADPVGAARMPEAGASSALARDAARRHDDRRPVELGDTMIKVILCDDHALIRRGIRDTLSDAPDIEVVGEAGDYGELRALMRNTALRRAGARHQHARAAAASTCCTC